MLILHFSKAHAFRACRRRFSDADIRFLTLRHTHIFAK